MYRVLLIDDQLSVAENISPFLMSSLLRLETARTLADAYDSLAEQRYDLLIVDRCLPDGDGLEIVDYVSTSRPDLPILILSQRQTMPDRILGLQKGADDYVNKPFSPIELKLRIEKLLMKTKHIDPQVLQVGDVKVFLKSGQVKVGEKFVHLRKREFEIFVFLIRHKNTVINREVIINHIWGEAGNPSYKTIDVYVRRVRILLGKQHQVLHTIRGFGYVVKD
jgi:DNA-binding response OmpR family regulator